MAMILVLRRMYFFDLSDSECAMREKPIERKNPSIKEKIILI
jgi:hypothetical protein